MQLKKYIVALLCLLIFVAYFPISFVTSKFYRLRVQFASTHEERKNQIKNWFNEEVVEYDKDNLHHGSAWRYLTAEEYKEIVLDGASKMDPKISEGSKIFELGVGVGAVLKVLEEHVGVGRLELGGSDIAENTIAQAKKIFPEQSSNFFVRDMILKHASIADNYYDHVISFGALAMYLTRDEMDKAIQEAIRMTKPGGSLLFSHFAEPGSKTIKSIVSTVEKSFFEKNAKRWGVEDVKIYPVLHQGDRYQVTFRKKK